MRATPTAPTADERGERRRADAPVRDGQLRAPRRWERLLVEAAVIGGRDRWRRRIDGLTNELRRKLAELGGEDETQAAALARTLDDLAAFAGYALPLIDELDSLPAEARWGEWLDRLGSACDASPQAARPRARDPRGAGADGSRSVRSS